MRSEGVEVSLFHVFPFFISIAQRSERYPTRKCILVDSNGVPVHVSAISGPKFSSYLRKTSYLSYVLYVILSSIIYRSIMRIFQPDTYTAPAPATTLAPSTAITHHPLNLSSHAAAPTFAGASHPNSESTQPFSSTGKANVDRFPTSFGIHPSRHARR